MIQEINNLLKEEDTEIFNMVECLEAEVLTQRKEEEIMYQKRKEKEEAMLSQINSLKELISKRQGNKHEKLLTEFNGLTNQSRNEVDVITKDVRHIAFTFVIQLLIAN